jgi:C-terminal processing protease CtpA/Prc
MKNKDVTPGTRVVSLIGRPDYDGFGFSIRPSERGPHQVSNVEVGSPGHVAGLLADDLILRVNDTYVVGQRFSKTAALIKNESEKGRIRLEVIEPHLCPEDIRATSLFEPTTSSASGTVRSSHQKDNIVNLKQITAEALAVAGNSSTLPAGASARGLSVDTGSDRLRGQQRPQSMTDIDRIHQQQQQQLQQNSSTVRSNASFYSSQNEPSTRQGVQSARSVGNLSTLNQQNQQQQQAYKPKFKRCVIQLIPEFQGLGFTLNSKIKPKYMIYSVDPNSPAHAANLRTNDIIVEIDRKNIRRVKFDKVRAMLSDVQRSNRQVEILAIDKEGYDFFKKKKKNFSSKKLVQPELTEEFSTHEGLRSRDQSSSQQPHQHSLNDGK